MKKLLTTIFILVCAVTAFGQVVETDGRLGIGTFNPQALFHIDNTNENYTELMRMSNDGQVYFHWVQRRDSTRGLCFFNGTYVAFGNKYGQQDPQLRIVHRPDLGFTIFNALSYSDPTWKQGLRFAASGELWLWTTNGDDIWMRGGAVKFLGDLRLMGLVEGTGFPTLGTVPKNKDLAVYRDSATSDVYLIFNDNGTLKTLVFQ